MSNAKLVTDKALLAQLEAQPVTDPAILNQLNGVQERGSLRNISMGMLKGASDIGATILRPVDAALNATGLTDTTNVQRRQKLGEFFGENADTSSWSFKGGELAADIAGTAGVAGVLGKAAGAIPGLSKLAPKLAAALQSGGFRIGAPAATRAGVAGDWATRIGAGAAVGGASAGLINPENAGMGAAIGGAFPVAAKVAGSVGSAISGKVSPEVAKLYELATKKHGIDIPVDRITNSRPLNAAASSLNYVPLSGRAAAEEKMVSQFNRAVSRTFGQDTDNITAALRKAREEQASARAGPVIETTATVLELGTGGDDG
jgi:hypothetical protein